MYEGWVAIGGREIVNNERVATYVRAAGYKWLNACDSCSTISMVENGLPCYVSVKDDPAPWFNPNRLESFLFLGALSLSVDGVDESTRKANVESGINSAWVTRTYRAPREIVMRMALVAVDDRGLSYGYEWLDDIPDGDCSGTTMDYYAACTCSCDPSAECLGACVGAWKRTLTRARLIQGFSVLNKYRMPTGGVVAEVEMIVGAADALARPYAWSSGGLVTV